MDNYSKGLHILLTLKVNQTEKLLDFEKFYQFSKKILAENDTEIVGETHHIFENNSFTTAICLKEYHICVHTWPEFNQLTLDVLLFNYINDNSKKKKKIANEYVLFFEEKNIQENKILRKWKRLVRNVIILITLI